MTTAGWTTPAAIRDRVRRSWERGDLLRAALGVSALPLTISLNRPRREELGTRFADVREWIHALEEGSKAQRGFGYEILWNEVNDRTLGSNRVPARVVVPTLDDAVRLIGMRRDAERFMTAAAETSDAFPELAPWIARNAMVLMEQVQDWGRVLAVLEWFRRNPRPGVYLRQLDIRGVDTKFIEARRGLIAELLDRILPETAIDASALGPRSFERRYGLAEKPVLVRFRFLDERGAANGFTDLSVPADQFAATVLDVDRVFITENDANGLAFPRVARSVVVFGRGYGLQTLARARWLGAKQISYWGDIDTHGFVMLDRMRHLFPNVVSFLMDRRTLESHRELWSHEPMPHHAPLTNLTAVEELLFEDLRHDRLGHGVRLEQERISFDHVTQALRALN